jgi:hypothetical protein
LGDLQVVVEEVICFPDLEVFAEVVAGDAVDERECRLIGYHPSIVIQVQS